MSRHLRIPMGSILGALILVLASVTISVPVHARPVAYRAGSAPIYRDSAQTIFGLSGAFGVCQDVKCGFAGPISLRQAARLGSSYVRISAVLNCPFAPQTPFRPVGSTAALADLLAQAASANLIPIVNFVTPDACSVDVPLTPADWKTQLMAFVSKMYRQGRFPSGKWIYYEIGNEINLTPGPYCVNMTPRACRDGGWENSYAQVFAAAAQGITVATAAAGSTTFRVLTAGMVHPTAASDCSDFFDPGRRNIDATALAIKTAEQAPYSIPVLHLGVSLHPYRYDTDEPSAWLNYFHEVRGYAGRCYDLGKLIDLWLATFPGMPLVFSEDNWSDAPAASPHCVALTRCEGTYLVDLITWLYDHPVKGPGSYADPATSPIRVTFFRGIDSAFNPLGIYGLSNGGTIIHDKPFWIGFCPSNQRVYGWKSMATVYSSLVPWSLTSAACY